ncbi:DNA repair protein [Gymnopus androsaceus JB14]|uniref:DNA repair protein REV1 n=1 Tax=Gymnopus androsaceus JB14 TaxID=1447944 RepID=A0A6A4IIJ6_9AGAR|nr:DNA repair protein [Gymnopus androsaceus JB14]
MNSMAPSGSNSSDYFGSDDSDFLEALAKTTLPGDIGFDEQFDRVEEIEAFTELTPPPPNQKALKRKLEDESDKGDNPQNEEIYGAARFGDFGQYMKRKRAKLQIQNKDIAANGGIFHGVSIYINGYTNPSIQDLRQLIVQHGGVFQAYLDKKTIVTHIITNALTPAKIAEWKHMKIVRPEWLVDSANRGMLLPWTDYIWKPINRLEATQGARSTQTSLDLPAPKTEQKLPSASVLTSNNRSERHSIPSYAAHDSNPLAQRAMHNQDWRTAHTSVAPDFIDGYYKNSRLHHLSSWKSELKELLREAQEKAENLEDGKVSSADDPIAIGQGFSMRGAGLVLRSPTKAKPTSAESRTNDEQRVIMHCDFDCFFVAAGLTKRPNLKGKPAVVCHSQDRQGGDASTSEIASASYEARVFGIKNGMSLQQARKLCPNVITIPYEFELYKQFSLKFYTVLMTHADDLQAVSVDEALIDVTLAVDRLREGAKTESTCPYDPAKELAELIRKQVKDSTGCEISIGISHNISLARLATRRAKPAKSYHLVPGEVHAFVAPLDIADLHGFGRAAKQKALDKWGTSTLGDLEEKSKATLSAVLGRTTGETLYNLIRGVDERRLENDKERKSVSCDINYGIRFQKNEEVKTFLEQMAKEVAKRLEAIGRRGRSITLKVMKRDPTAPVEPPKFLGHGACDVFNKQTTLSGPGGRPIATSDETIMADHAWRLLKSLNFDAKELRGLGIQIQKLEPSSITSPSKPNNTNIQGQGRLPFLKSVGNEGKSSSSSGSKQGIASELPTTGQNEAPHDLPSFSQVDKSIFEALPQDIKQELENEYKRRSASPFVPAAPVPVQFPVGHVIPNNTKPDVMNQNGRPVVFPFPRRMPSPGGPNVRRITAQLDPSHSRSFSPRKPKHNQFTKLPGLASWKVPASELLKLDIDPEVFFALPRNVQREQLTAARMLKTLGYIPEGTDERVDLRPVEPDPGDVTYLPPPKARFVQPPMLKQAGPTPGEKLYFIETDDVQRIIGEWVMRFKLYPPNKQDIAFFAKWLVRSVDRAQAGDEGLLRAVAVVKWWLVLLKRCWGEYEYGVGYGGGSDDPEENRKAKIGQAWWNAFRDVKGQMDDVARRRFGGKLSLR